MKNKHAITFFNWFVGFLTFFFLPTFVLMAFNRMDGAPNPEGEMFVPLGWLVLALMPLAFTALQIAGVYFMKKERFKGYWMAVFVALYVAGAVMAVLLIDLLRKGSYWDFLRVMS